MSDSALSTASDISKLKVADLRRELKSRGLSVAGTKPELVDRLQGALLTGDGSDESALADSALIDEDDVLNDVELDEDKSLDLYTTAHEDTLITPPITMTTQPTLKRTHIEMTSGKSESKENAPKKIILNRNSTTVPVSVPETKPTAEGTAEKNGKDQGTEKKVIKIGSLSEKERLERRARKFGMPLTSDLKKEERAQRFGLNNTKSISNNKVDTSLEVLKKRAERFGSSVSKKLSEAQAKEKLEKRKERFCSAQPTTVQTSTVQATNVSTTAPKLKIKTSMTNDEKAKQRLERFKIEVK